MDSVENVLAQWTEERPDLDPSPIAIFGRVQRIAGLASQSLRDYLEPFDLNPVSFDILCNLRRSGRPYRKTPSELAASSLLTTGAMTGRLDALTAAGLIRRQQHPTDRRVSYAELTTKGRRLIDRVITGHLDCRSQLLAKLTDADRDTVERALSILEDSVQSAGQP